MKEHGRIQPQKQRIRQSFHRRDDTGLVVRFEHGGKRAGRVVELCNQCLRDKVGRKRCRVRFRFRGKPEELERFFHHDPGTEGFDGQVQIVACLAEGNVQAVVRRNLGAIAAAAKAIR